LFPKDSQIFDQQTIPTFSCDKALDPLTRWLGVEPDSQLSPALEVAQT